LLANAISGARVHQRRGTGQNWVIGVRQSGQGGNQGGGQGGHGAEPGNQNGRIRVLFIVGTKDNTPVYQAAIKKSKEDIDRLIRNSQLSRNDEVLFLEGDRATKDNILSTVRRCSHEAGPNGAVLVYYLGHGATFSSQHYILPMADDEGEMGQPIARNEIYNALVAGRTRFAGLITDSCSNVLETEGVERIILEVNDVSDRRTITPMRGEQKPKYLSNGLTKTVSDGLPRTVQGSIRKGTETCKPPLEGGRFVCCWQNCFAITIATCVETTTTLLTGYRRKL